MGKVFVCDDIELCSGLWDRLWGEPASVFDLWDARMCFQQAYQRTPCFVASRNREGRLNGLLPLSWVEEAGAFAFFPGEIWNRKTWLEGNRIFSDDYQVFQDLLAAVPGPAHIRYLDSTFLPYQYDGATEDEVGYLFFPRKYNYDFSAYQASFPRKRLKAVLGEITRIENKGVAYRFNCLKDVDALFAMNLEAFGERSYYNDPRFQEGFQRLVALLDAMGALRVVTVLVQGAVAAVDVGAVCFNNYTVLGGGTNRDFLGVAKLINFKHMEMACKERFDSVDFLCGSFGWKEQFRLARRPLFEIHAGIKAARRAPAAYEESAVAVA